MGLIPIGNGLVIIEIYFRRAADKLESVRWPIIIAISCSILGFSILTFGRSLILINLGGFVMGFGSGVEGAIIGRVALLKPERTHLF